MTTLQYQVNNFKNFKTISEAANLEKRMKKLNFCPLFKMMVLLRTTGHMSTSGRSCVKRKDWGLL